MNARVAVSALALFSAAGLANAAAFFAYEDPSGDREVEYTAPSMPGEDGTLTVDTMVDLQVDLTDHGLGVLNFNNASFTKTASIGPATEIMPGVYIATSMLGEFRFETAGGVLILEGSYDGGIMSITTLSGGLTANAMPGGGSLTYNYGPDLVNALAGAGLVFGDAVDAAWTLTAITQVMVLPNGYLASFEANGAFTGTAEVIPTPGSLALAGVAGLVAIRRRRTA